ncbi:MAG: hypothetical protein IKD41_07230 [Alistipes sp.]|nr:hypothetical protein [Alistipes sp.]
MKRICKQMRKYNKLQDSIVADNLKYLIHMVGDMHCPVHTKYSPNEPELKQRSVKMKGKKMGFHSFWDASIGYYNKNLKCDQIARSTTPLPTSRLLQFVRAIQTTGRL